MRLTIEHTDEVVTVGGVRMRVWRGLTPDGAPCYVLVYSVAGDSMLLAAEAVAELQEIELERNAGATDLDRLAVESVFRKLDGQGLRFFGRLEDVARRPEEPVVISGGLADGRRVPWRGEIVMAFAGLRDEVRFRHWLDGNPLARGSRLVVVKSSRVEKGTHVAYTSKLDGRTAPAVIEVLKPGESKLPVSSAARTEHVKMWVPTEPRKLFEARRDESFRWATSEEV